MLFCPPNALTVVDTIKLAYNTAQQTADNSRLLLYFLKG